MENRTIPESTLARLDRERQRKTAEGHLKATYEDRIRPVLKACERDISEVGKEAAAEALNLVVGPEETAETEAAETEETPEAVEEQEAPETAEATCEAPSEPEESPEAKAIHEELAAARAKEFKLPKHNGKSWFKGAINGFFIGLAIIVPGISGATISIIFKLYDSIVYAVSQLLKHFGKAFVWLLPLIVGGIIGIVLGFFGVQYALDYIPFGIICLFAGLMIGAFPSVWKEISGARKTPWRWTLLAIGIVIPILLSALTTNILPSSGDKSLTGLGIGDYIILLVIGIVVALTQLVPGLSASAFLMMTGYFTVLVNSISLSYWKENPSVFIVYVVLVVGFIVGLLAFSSLLNLLFKKKRETSFFLIVGLSIGSIVCMFYNPEVYEVYQGWAENGMSSSSVGMYTDIGIGAALLVVGIAISLALVIYEFRKAKRESQPDSLSLKDKG